MIEVSPNPGPQWAFLECEADVAFYGGAAGAGKSFAATLLPLRHWERSGYCAIVLRREATRLTGSGSIWEEMCGIYPALGGKQRGSPTLEWRSPHGALVELRHLQYEKDVHAHQGKQYAAIIFDEVCEFTGSQFWYMLSRLRTTCGIRPYVRGTCNPDPDSFVRELISWWLDPDGFPILDRSGVLRWFVRDGDDLAWFDTEADARARFPERNPLSFTFIAASLADNPKGDPTYRDKLEALPRVERERLLGGNWNIRAAAGLVFPRSCWGILDATPRDVVRRVRAWDRAATKGGGDWTRGVRVAQLRDGRYVIEHVEGIQGSPGEVESLILRTAALDGPSVEVVIWQDPGADGVAARDHLTEVLAGFHVTSHRAARDKLAYAGTWSARVEQGRVFVLRGPWTEAYLAEHESFPGGRYDDQVDATSLAFQAMDGTKYQAALAASAGRWL